MELHNNEAFNRQKSDDYLKPISTNKDDVSADANYDETTQPNTNDTEVVLSRPKSTECEVIYSELDEEVFNKSNDVSTRETNRYEKLPNEKPPVNHRVSRRPFVEYSISRKSSRHAQKKLSKNILIVIAMITIFVLIICVGGGILFRKVTDLYKELDRCRSGSGTPAIPTTSTPMYVTHSEGPDFEATSLASLQSSTDTSMATSDMTTSIQYTSDAPQQESSTTGGPDLSQILVYNSLPRLIIQSINPVGVAVNSINGDMYVAELSQHRICRYNDQGVLYSCFHGSGLVEPRGLTLTTNADDEVRLLVTDEHYVNMFHATGALVFRHGSSVGSNSRGKFNIPYSITTDAKRLIYVCDYLNHRIQVVNQIGFVQHVENLPDGISGQPSGIAISKLNGDIYVVFGQKVHVYDSTWHYKTFLKVSGEEMKPFSVATDDEGHIIITDYACQCIRVFDKDHKEVQKFGSAGSCDQCFSYPSALAVNANTGELMVSDNTNNRVMVFSRIVHIRP